VSGPSKVSFNSESEFECRSAPSQPPARISWKIRIQNEIVVDLREGLNNENDKVFHFFVDISKGRIMRVVGEESLK
jgi:hypothetical protein